MTWQARNGATMCYLKYPTTYNVSTISTGCLDVAKINQPIGTFRKGLYSLPGLYDPVNI